MVFFVPASFELATVYYQPDTERSESEIRIGKFQIFQPLEFFNSFIYFLTHIFDKKKCSDWPATT